MRYNNDFSIFIVIVMSHFGSWYFELYINDFLVLFYLKIKNIIIINIYTLYMKLYSLFYL